MKPPRQKAKPAAQQELVSAVPAQARSSAGLLLLICCGLAAVTFLVFLPVLHNDFVNYDDPDYVTANSHVLTGLSLENVRWAFTTGHASNWHPLTWISHMLDCSLFGERASGHHLVNLLFHVANAVLLFLVLWQMTRALWPCAVVAFLFALHPSHVESVAWISERKDVLSLFFALLVIQVYRNYSNARANSRKAGGLYVLVLFLFCLGLMSKPMLVTLPFLLLLLDYWPLRRVKPVRTEIRRYGQLLIEKLPLFLLSLASSIITFLVQRKGGAVSTSISLAARIENALVACLRYIGDLFWPHNLAVLYPHPGQWPAWQIIVSAAALLFITAATIVSARSRPHLMVGWLWFLGSLAPVIGLVQVGVQSMADRYTYLPFIGLFIMLAWSLQEIIQKFAPTPVPAASKPAPRHSPGALAQASPPGPSTAFALITALLLLGLSAMAFAANEQVRLWKNSETLFRHTAAVTKNNYLAYNNLGYYLSNRGDVHEAITNYQRALQIKPDYEDALNNMGYALAGQKKYREAIEYYERALRVRPNHTEVHNNLGNALSDIGRVEEAIPHYQFVLNQKPDHADAHNNYGVALAMKGQFEEAIDHFHSALRYKPGYASAHSNLGNTYAVQHKLDQAIAEYEQSIKLNPQDAQAHNNLGNVLAEQGKLDLAANEYGEALKLNANNPEAHFNLGMVLLRRSQPEEAAKHFREALRLKPDYTEAEKQLQALPNR